MKPFFLFLCLSACFICKAQYTLKPKLGFALSRVKQPIDPYSFQTGNQVSKIGLQAGGGVEYNLNTFFSAEADLLYTQKGLRDTVHIRSMTPNTYYKGYAYRFHYIELPVLLHFKVDDHLKLGAGPSLSYLLKAQYFLDGKKKNNSSIDYSNFDVGLVADASWTVKRFEGGARFTYGLSTMKLSAKYFDPELSLFSNGPIGKNRSFQFYLNYLIKK